MQIPGLNNAIIYKNQYRKNFLPSDTIMSLDAEFYCGFEFSGTTKV
jgi:hypothetical protein